MRVTIRPPDVDEMTSPPALCDDRIVIEARFGHLNLIARDWRGLAAFYTRVFGCEFVPPERDYRGPDLSAGTGIADAALAGVHLRLPGGGPSGPTLEIYQYDPALESLPTAANRPGFGHIAFVVSSVDEARATVLAEGGRPVGEVVTLRTSDGRLVTWTYVTDPEGNIIELQSWSNPG
jgi:predicted enzyme related to lactoylglutathione lyase